jgi:dihydropteroate synthase
MMAVLADLLDNINSANWWDSSRPLVMGILNVTPDSFSDGGRYNQIDNALSHVQQMLDDGADIVDVGGESTRPGAVKVSIDEELQRTIPVVSEIKRRFGCRVSIDTSKAEVMNQAVHAGADMVNDVFALQQKSALDTVAILGVPVCLMHMQGQPDNMQEKPEYSNPVNDIVQFFSSRIETCINAGILRDNIIIDPGFGFGKTLEHNLLLLSHLNEFCRFNLPVLVGISRKSMLEKILQATLENRLAGSLAAMLIAVQKGARIVRVHDVKESVAVLKVLSAVDSVSGN